ncbi:MAG TPA: flap endonuclease-1 [Candidatus Lokiarchaeia archaeon]|nr:flap endonuclease-1 [Candidatus Lokiarchaeia archaeon]
MGVKLTDLVADAKKIITFENLMGKEIAIDAYNSLYQFLAIIRGVDGEPLKDDAGNVTSHLQGIFSRTVNFLEQNLKPAFVFDGKPPERKMETIAERVKVRQEATEKWTEAKDAGDEESAQKFAQASSKLTKDMVEEAKRLLRALGLPVIDAPEDGEAQAAYLASQDVVWAAASQDYDSILFGAPRLIRNLAERRQRKVKGTTRPVDLEWYSQEKILEVLQLTREQIIDLAIMIGTDFNPSVEGVGPKTAYNLMQEYGTLDKILEENVTVRGHIIAESLTQKDVDEVRAIFLQPNVRDLDEELKWGRPNLDEVREILVTDHNFDAERVETQLKRLKKSMKGGSQKTLDNLFGKKA